jgi:hypothetical protein
LVLPKEPTKTSNAHENQHNAQFPTAGEYITTLGNPEKKHPDREAVGKFGISTAASFVPGLGGTIISDIQTLDSVTKQVLNMDPDEKAAVNRERLEKLDVREEDIKGLLLNDKLTPTEKTLAVGYLDSLSGAEGLGELLSFIATSVLDMVPLRPCNCYVICPTTLLKMVYSVAWKL